MAKFHFRLQTLRRLRELDRNEARLRLAQAQQAAQILAQRQESIASELTELRQSQRALCERQAMDVNQLLQTQRFQLTLQAQNADLIQQAEKVSEELERRRQAVVEADQQVRVLDRLEARRRAEHQRAKAAAECKRLDEVGATRRGEIAI